MTDNEVFNQYWQELFSELGPIESVPAQFVKERRDSLGFAVYLVGVRAKELQAPFRDGLHKFTKHVNKILGHGN